jgi:hypothetical protein
MSLKRNFAGTKWQKRDLFRRYFGEILQKRISKKYLFRQNFAKISRRNDTQHILVQYWACHMAINIQHGHEHAAFTRTCSMTWRCSMDLTWKISMYLSMLHVHVHTVSPCPCCMSMSMLHIFIHAACPCPCYMSMSKLHV